MADRITETSRREAPRDGASDTQDHHIGEVTLVFGDQTRFDRVSDAIEEDLSAAARAGGALFVSCDETAGIERIRKLSADKWGDHKRFGLGDIFDLPDGADGEMDIEGLEADEDPSGPWLWVAGSHSLKRGKPDDDETDPEAALADMAEIKRDPNRYTLTRLPLAEDEDGLLAPVAEDGARKAASVKLKEESSKLVEWLKDDAHIGPYVTTPSKENGLDIEGIASHGSRIWLGLRGPVLRGSAVILEMEFKTTSSGRLKPKKIDGERRYRKHLIPTRGLGVRDLARDGDDILVLLGPTMSADGPARILRWVNGAMARTSGVRAAREFEHALELPYLGQFDHPEGLCRWPEAGEDAWLVVYDSPAPARLKNKGASVVADVVSLARAG